MSVDHPLHILLPLCVLITHTLPLSGELPLLNVLHLLHRLVSVSSSCLTWRIEACQNFKILWAVCKERFHEASQFWVIKGVSGCFIQNIDEQECLCWSDRIDHLGTGRFFLLEDKWRKLDITELEFWLLVLWVHGSICFLLPSGQFCVAGKTGKLIQSSAEGRNNK